MNILYVTPTFHPATAFGGSTEAVWQLVKHVAQIPGNVVHVLTTDSDGEHRHDRIGVLNIPYLMPEGYTVHYCRKTCGREWSWQLWKQLPVLIQGPDLHIIHLMGVYSWTTPVTLALAKWYGKPVMWSPHGSLMEWHGTRHKTAKVVWRFLCRRLAS